MAKIKTFRINGTPRYLFGKIIQIIYWMIDTYGYDKSVLLAKIVVEFCSSDEDVDRTIKCITDEFKFYEEKAAFFKQYKSKGKTK